MRCRRTRTCCCRIKARVDTKPQLEIYADDVKCAHGAAVGQIDPEELFYLETRGIGPELGRSLLTYGFAEEVIGKIKIDSIRSQLDETVLRQWDVERIRADFPVLHQTVNGKPLVYLDNAASSQVPQVVIDRGSIYLEQEHSNIHRGVHYLSQKATTAYEGAREKVKRFINAREARECIFVRGATEGINLVMHGYGRKFIGAGDEIIISAMEHHANIVPWQMLCEEKGARCASFR
jgi:hypothetical protein